jgi:hypothetical protein
MQQVFLIQVISSFFIGGISITLISMLAERMSEKIAGVIMMFPTTAALGFLFLGITTSHTHVAAIVPAALVPLGVVVLSSYIYISFANFYHRHFPHRFTSMLLSFSSTSIIWLLIVIPYAWQKIYDLKWGIAGYLILVALTTWFYSKKSTVTVTQKNSYSKKAILLRSAFVGTIISLVVITGKLINPYWAGIVTMYPAATMATLIILHFYYQPSQLYHFFRRAPLGSLSVFSYCIAITWLYPRAGLLIGTIGAYLISAVVSAVLITISGKRYPKLNMITYFKKNRS